MDEREFFRRQSPVSDPGPFRAALADLPADVGSLAALVRQLIVHREETRWLFGFRLPEARRSDADLRYAHRIFARLGDLSERDPRERFAGTCRDFALLLCTMLRQHRIPARLRCGFAGYFVPGFFDDHWVVEYGTDDGGWRLADAQVAGEASRGYRVPFDPLDVPRDQFLVAGQAWRDCRSGRRDPETFGVSAAYLHGMVEVQGNVLRDLAALNRVEVLPWDDWGLIELPFAELAEPELALLDQVATLSADGGPLSGIVACYRSHPELRPPAAVGSAPARGACDSPTTERSRSDHDSPLPMPNIPRQPPNVITR